MIVFVARHSLSALLLLVLWKFTSQVVAATDNGPWQVTVMPKLVDIPYYDRVKQGVMAADAELDAVAVKWLGPARALVERQLDLLESELYQHPDVIAVAANEPQAMGDFFRLAEGHGIIPMSWGGDASYRHFFVNLVSYRQFAETLVARLAALVPAESRISIITTSFSSPNQTHWLREIKKCLYRNHPGILIDDVQAAGESELQSYRIALDFLQQSDLPAAIVALGVPNLPGAARAVEQLGLTGKVMVLGNSTEDLIQPFIERGSVQLALSWNPHDHGYLLVYSAYRLLKGEIKRGRSFQAGRLGAMIPEQDDRGLQVYLPLIELDADYFASQGWAQQ